MTVTSATTHEPDDLRQRVADERITLPAGRLPCASCGVATSPPATKAGVTYAEVNTYGPTGRVARTARVALGLCEDCASLSAHALALVAAHPALTAALGSARAVEAAEGVVTALGLLGHPLPSPDVEDRRLGLLVRNLATLGLAVRYRRHASPEKANPYPWAHVRSTERESLRHRYAAVRVAESSGPVKIAPPRIDPHEVSTGSHAVEGACGICGVGHVSVPATTVARTGGREAVARLTWRLHTGVSPDSLGARRSPVRLAIWLCPACEDAYGWEQSMGASMMERALYAHLDRLGSLGPDVEVPGLVGWAGLCADALRRGRPLPKPGRVPWDHVDVTGV